ncbi:MAG: adenylosuccinate synthetase, partial [Desulfovibrio sp.]|nr:adenylosuccinate synthetase [Desulfovibrio sp.]
IAYPPQGENALAEVKPIYEELPGFSEDITGCRAFAALPGNVQKYIKRIEALTGVKVSIVSVGADREETIER